MKDFTRLLFCYQFSKNQDFSKEDNMIEQDLPTYKLPHDIPTLIDLYDRNVI